MRRLLGNAVVAAGLGLFCAAPAQAATIYLVDFIPDGSRSHFNSFEGIPNDGTHYTGGAGPYIEDGISVRQVNGNPGNDIWVGWFTPDGTKGWYPDGGDEGYTEITRSGGLDFFDVGFLRGTGFSSPATNFFELWNNGEMVLSGSVESPTGPTSAYLGFGGGGFDEIRLWATLGANGGINAFAVDAIELGGQTGPGPVPVPDPGSSLLLLGMGLAGLRAWKNRLG